MSDSTEPSRSIEESLANCDNLNSMSLMCYSLKNNIWPLSLQTVTHHRVDFKTETKRETAIIGSGNGQWNSDFFVNLYEFIIIIQWNEWWIYTSWIIIWKERTFKGGIWIVMESVNDRSANNSFNEIKLILVIYDQHLY